MVYKTIFGACHLEKNTWICAVKYKMNYEL